MYSSSEIALPHPLDQNDLPKKRLTEIIQALSDLSKPNCQNDIAREFLKIALRQFKGTFAILGIVNRGDFVQFYSQDQSEPEQKTAPCNWSSYPPPRHMPHLPATPMRQALKLNRPHLTTERLTKWSPSASTQSDDPLSVFCYPITNSHHTIGVIYIEFNNIEHKLNERITTLKLICDHAGIALSKVKQRTETRSEIRKDQRSQNEPENDPTVITSIISEIRTQISSVIGFSKLIQDKGLNHQDPKTINHYARNIHQSGLHLVEILQNISCLLDDSSTKTPGPKEWADPRFLILHGYHLNQPIARSKKIHLSYSIATTIPKSLFLDRSAFLRLCVRCIAFAIDLTQSGGRVQTCLAYENDVIKLSATSTMNPRPAHPDNDAVSDKDIPDGIPYGHSSRHADMLKYINKSASRLSGDVEFIHQTHMAVVYVTIPISASSCARIGEIKKTLPMEHANKWGIQPEGMSGTQFKALIEDFNQLSKIPVFKGGTSKKLIRQMKRSHVASNHFFMSILDRLETTIYEGDQNTYLSLIQQALNKGRQLHLK